MTVVDLSDLNPGVWFEMEGGGKVKLRTLSLEELRKIRSQAVKKRIEYKKVEGSPQRFEVEDTNEELYQKLTWDYCIMDWENLFDGSGNSIPCTVENKILLMDCSLKFARFVMDSMTFLSEQQEGETEKNLKTSQNG